MFLIMISLSIAMICIEWCVEYPNGEWYIGYLYLGLTSAALIGDIKSC